ncbi:MAG: AsmA family protein, partial [Proteobacteria bacterium]|nr:AsmA family protein [Pseudomonadota bacterium]
MIIKKLLRYSGLALAILFIFWIIGVAAVYFLVNVEDIKKFAVTKINENTTGELSLGEIKLKVFPLVHFEIKDIAFLSSPNFDKKEMFSCKNARLSFNVFTLIIGKPRITLRLDNPSLDFISDGKTNNINDAFATEKKKSSQSALTYLFISRFIFKINDASLKYKTPKDFYEIKGLNLYLNVDPVSRDLDLNISTPIDYKKLDTVIKGDLGLNAKIKVASKESSEIKLNLDATKLLINTKSIEKKKGDALKIVVLAESDLKTSIKIKDLTVTLIEELLKTTGNLSITDPQKISLKIDFSKNYDFSNFRKLFKNLSDYKLSG